ncbi:MAG: protein kinase domain-containing protein [Ktedonobacterales bacterium]
MELEVLGDRYEMQEPIGRGGMATIYRAVDLRMGRTVAAKILREVYSSDPKFVTRFQREARAASALQHPNIVQVFDYGQSGESYYIVMEFVDGSDLRRYLKKQGVLTNERAIEIAHDVALGLGAAHKRGIVHRDVKPQNVMLNDSGLVKLTDFGIASMYKDAEAERLTTTGMTLGTVQYYAPEQAQGEIVSPAADIYALGIVMYEMLTGRTPFDGDTPVAVAMRHIQDIPAPPSSLNPRITPGLERIILRCLEKDPRDRYRDGDALAFALENLARSSGGARRQTGTAPSAGVRSQFAPIGLPSTGPAPYGGPAVASGPSRPRPGAISSPVGMGRSSRPGFTGSPSGPSGPGNILHDEPTFDDGFGSYGSPSGGPGVNTRPYGPAAGTLPRSPATGHPSAPYGTPERPGPGKNNAPLIGVIVAAAVLLLGLTCFLIINLTGAGSAFSGLLGNAPTPTLSPTVALTTVPNFVNMDLTVAQSRAHDAHLVIDPNTDVTLKTDPTVKKGVIMQQTPDALTQQPWDTHIKVTVSNGPEKVQVPQVTGLLLSAALAKLHEVHLDNIQQTYQERADVAPNTVLAVSPPEGTPVDPGTTITLTVSQAPAVTPTPTTAVPTATPTATTGTSAAPGTGATPAPGPAKAP